METNYTAALGPAIDLSHHVSEIAKARRFSPLKSFAKYMMDPSVRSLAGGLPHPGFFPFETLSSMTLKPDAYQPAGVAPKQVSWLEKLLGSNLTSIEVPKYGKTRAELQLSSGLQYGAASGFAELTAFLREWTSIITPPAYSNWEVLLCDGSTDGWHKIVELLCEKGDGIIVEAFTYPSAIETGWPMGVRPVPIAIDDLGLIPEALDDVLANWDDSARGGMRRPRVFYTVPIGQNPCGSTLGEDRREAIYKLAVKYDFIIVEDDPYHSLNFGPYGVPAPGSDVENDPKATEQQKNDEFVKNTGLSYLKKDFQGRVIRIDTFSKTVAPGCRLGWTTANPLFTERLLRASETSTQQPSGFVQILVSRLIVEQWQLGGWIRWLRGLRGEYGRRRDWMIEELVKGFKIDIPPASSSLYSATTSPRLSAYRTVTAGSPSSAWDEKRALALGTSSVHGSKGKRIFSFVPPTAGMFAWVVIHFDALPAFAGKARVNTEDVKKASNDLFIALAEAKVLVAPGWMFEGSGNREGAPDEDSFAPTAESILLEGLEQEDGASLGHFRLAFATLEEGPMRQTMKDFVKVVNKFFA